MTERRASATGDGDERSLVRRASAGDADAFELLVNRYAPQTFRLLVRLAGNPTDAEDVLQETLIKAWRAMPRFRGDARFSTWLHRIAVNEANRRFAREQRHRSLPLEETMAEIPDIADGPAALAESAELRARLEACILELPLQYRAAVVLRDVEGLSNEEAAAALGLNLRNFKSRLHRGRMGLRRRLEELSAL